MPGMRRREALGAGAAGALAAAGIGSDPVAARRLHRRRFDTVVVGAGLAGLTAAPRLRAPGRSGVGLEAPHRGGGRKYDPPHPGGGGVLEMGGEWAGPGQDKVLALAKELGVGIFETYSDGNSIYYSGGQRSTYGGDIPPANPVALAEVEATIVLLNQMASE